MSDTLNDERSIRTVNVINEKVSAGGREAAPEYFNHEGLGIDIDLSLPSQRVICSLEQIIERCGKPTKNAYIERFIPKEHNFHSNDNAVWFSFNRTARHA